MDWHADEGLTATQRGRNQLRQWLLSEGFEPLPWPTKDSLGVPDYEGVRVKFGKRSARYQEKFQGAWRSYGPTIYYGYTADDDDAKAWAFYLRKAVEGDPVPEPVPPEPTEAEVKRRQERRRREEEESGPGFYVSNSGTGTTRVAELGPYETFDKAEDAAVARLREFVRMKFDYLLPVQVIEAESRDAAEMGEGYVWWEDGLFRGPPVDPRQMKFPGMSERGLTTEELARQYQERHDAEVEAGGAIEIDSSIPTVFIRMSDGTEYWYQEWQADNLLKEAESDAGDLLDHIPMEVFLLASAQNW